MRTGNLKIMFQISCSKCERRQMIEAKSLGRAAMNAKQLGWHLGNDNKWYCSAHPVDQSVGRLRNERGEFI